MRMCCSSVCCDSLALLQSLTPCRCRYCCIVCGASFYEICHASGGKVNPHALPKDVSLIDQLLGSRLIVAAETPAVDARSTARTAPLIWCMVSVSGLDGECEGLQCEWARW